MSIVVKMPSASEQRERRLHLREINIEEPARLTGMVLRDKRIELGLDEKSIAMKLKMRIDQLRAIEHGDHSRLPARTYAVGFVRAYAKTLGLDAESLVEQFKAETQSHEMSRPAELVFPEVAMAPKWPGGGIVVVALVVAIVIYGIAQLTMPSAQQSKVAAIPDSQVTVVEDVASPGSTGAGLAAASTGVTVSAAVPGTQKILPVIGDGASVTEAMIRVLVAAVQPSPVQGAESVSAVPAASTALTPPAVPATALAAGSRITLRALEATYVQVKDLALRKPHSVLLARVMNPGESFQAPDRARLVLLTGNAGGIQVEIDGRNAGILGKSGQVIKRLALDPAYFLSRTGTSR